MRGHAARRPFRAVRAALLALQCAARRRAARTAVRARRAEARDVGKLQQSNEALKAEIARLQENAAAETRAREASARAKAEADAAALRLELEAVRAELARTNLAAQHPTLPSPSPTPLSPSVTPHGNAVVALTPPAGAASSQRGRRDGGGGDASWSSARRRSSSVGPKEQLARAQLEVVEEELAATRDALAREVAAHAQTTARLRTQQSEGGGGDGASGDGGCDGTNGGLEAERAARVKAEGERDRALAELQQIGSLIDPSLSGGVASLEGLLGLGRPTPAVPSPTARSPAVEAASAGEPSGERGGDNGDNNGESPATIAKPASRRASLGQALNSRRSASLEAGFEHAWHDDGVTSSDDDTDGDFGADATDGPRDAPAAVPGLSTESAEGAMPRARPHATPPRKRPSSIGGAGAVAAAHRRTPAPTPGHRGSRIEDVLARATRSMTTMRERRDTGSFHEGDSGGLPPGVDGSATGLAVSNKTHRGASLVVGVPHDAKEAAIRAKLAQASGIAVNVWEVAGATRVVENAPASLRCHEPPAPDEVATYERPAEAGDCALPALSFASRSVSIFRRWRGEAVAPLALVEVLSVVAGYIDVISGTGLTAASLASGSGLAKPGRGGAADPELFIALTTDSRVRTVVLRFETRVLRNDTLAVLRQMQADTQLGTLVGVHRTPSGRHLSLDDSTPARWIGESGGESSGGGGGSGATRPSGLLDFRRMDSSEIAARPTPPRPPPPPPRGEQHHGADNTTEAAAAASAQLAGAQRKLALERANYEKAMLQILELQNDLTASGSRAADAKRDNEALKAQLALKESEYRDYSRTRLQLGKKLQSMLLENGELRHELDVLRKQPQPQPQQDMSAPDARGDDRAAVVAASAGAAATPSS